MKAELALTDLQRYLRVLTAVAASNIKSRYTPPSVIGIDVSGQTVTLTAATWQITGQLTLGGGMSDGSVAVEATQLSAAINAIAPPRIRRTTIITLAGVPGHLHVSGASTVTLGANSDWTAPPLPQPQPQQHVVQMPVRDWTNTVTAVMRAIDKRDGRHVHGGLRLYREPGCCLIVEATDRMRIHRQVIGDPQPGPHESRLAMTPAKLLLRLLALAGDTDQVTVGYGDDTLLAVSGPVAAKAPAWDGWPDVQIVLEYSIEHGAAFNVNSHDMGEALRAARAVADPANPRIDLDLDPAGRQISLLVPGRDRPLLTQLIAVAQVRGSRQQFGLRADHASDVFTAIAATDTTLTLPQGHNLLGITAGRFHAALVRYSC